MLCVRCNKRPAIVFVQKMDGENTKSEGYCLTCAREIGIKPVDDIMKQFGISDSDLETMEERFSGMMQNGDVDVSEMMKNMSEEMQGYSEENDELQQLEADNGANSSAEDEEDDF
ncbi:MAG: ATP-dependent Clp protease ATP-binding subunit, partial [Ruthenibacterium sp.]